MNLIQFEIDICERNIKFEKSLLKRCKQLVLLSLLMICILSITAYYLDSANWLDGFAIGVNVINITYLLLLKSVAKSEICFYELKLDLYEKIQKV